MPRQFTDNKGEKWTISITLWKTRYVRERLPLDIFNPNDWTELMTCLGSRFAYVWWLLQDQAKELNVDAEEFERRLYGGTYLLDASAEFQAELADFFRRLGGHEKWAKATDAARTAMEKDHALEMDPEKMEEYQALLESLMSQPSMLGDRSPD